MKGFGRTIKRMVKGWSYFIMVHFTKAISVRVNQMEWENFNGVMEKFMKANGARERNMVPVFGRVLKEIHILESGNKEFLMVMVFIVG